MKLVFLIIILAIFSVAVSAQKAHQGKTDMPYCGERLNQLGRQQGLFIAISDEKIDCVKKILGTGLNPNYRLNNEFGTSPILVVLVKGNAEIMRELIKAGADVKSYEGQFALIAASQDGYLDIIKMLLEAGADINARVKNKTTALMSASFHGQEKVVDFLLKSGANVNVISDEGKSALMLSSNNINILKALLNAGVKIDVVDNKGWTALFYAIENVHYEKLEILLENGASVNLTDKNGITALLLAEQIKDSAQKEKTISLLKKYSAK